MTDKPDRQDEFLELARDMDRFANKHLGLTTDKEIARRAAAVFRSLSAAPSKPAPDAMATKTGIEAAEMLTDYLRVRTTELDAGDAANIVHFLNENGLLNLRVPAPAVATEPGAVRQALIATRNWLDTQFNETINNTKLAEVIGNINDALSAAPPVRGDRETIARALWVSRGGKPENFNRHWPQRHRPPTSLYVPFQECLRDADAILSLPVQPGAGEREAFKREDVVRLVIAARTVAFGDDHGGEEGMRELDLASEQFAASLPWADQPNEDEL